MAKVFVGNFSFAINEDKLKEHFSKVGEVVSTKIMREAPNGRSRGFGFVEFTNEEDATRAIADLDNSNWEGRVIKVSQDRSGKKIDGTPNDGAPQNNGYQNRRFSNNQEQSGGYDRNAGPMGYFRAQPLDLGYKKKKKTDPFLQDEELFVDYKDPRILLRFMSERGKILPRRMTGLTAAHQRRVTKAIKRAHQLGMLLQPPRPTPPQ